jgi:hypothetical protein
VLPPPVKFFQANWLDNGIIANLCIPFTVYVDFMKAEAAFAVFFMNTARSLCME